MKKRYLITYDVHTNHEQIIQDLITNNWHSVVQGYTSENKPVICYMPETTWWKEFNSSREAYNEFKLIAGAQNIIRQTVSIFEEWIISTNNPMKHQIDEARRLGLVNSN